MQTTTSTHPLVMKAAQRWLDLAARHNVPATAEPMPDGEYFVGGLIVTIEPKGWFGESASVQIYPPMRPGRRVRQTALYLTYHLINGKPRFGRKPRITLHDMAFNIANLWDRQPKAGAQA